MKNTFWSNTMVRVIAIFVAYENRENKQFLNIEMHWKRGTVKSAANGIPYHCAVIRLNLFRFRCSRGREFSRSKIKENGLFTEREKYVLSLHKKPVFRYFKWVRIRFYCTTSGLLFSCRTPGRLPSVYNTDGRSVIRFSQVQSGFVSLPIRKSGWPATTRARLPYTPPSGIAQMFFKTSRNRSRSVQIICNYPRKKKPVKLIRRTVHCIRRVEESTGIYRIVRVGRGFRGKKNFSKKKITVCPHASVRLPPNTILYREIGRGFRERYAVSFARVTVGVKKTKQKFQLCSAVCRISFSFLGAQ